MNALRSPISCIAADFGGTIAVSGSATAPDGQLAAQILRDEFGVPAPADFATVLDETSRELHAVEKVASTQTGYPGILSMVADRFGMDIPDPVAVAIAVFDAVADAHVDLRAAQALKDLAAAGIRLVLASNTRWPGPVRERTLRQAGIAECFAGVVLSSELGLAKPHPGFYSRVLELAGCPPEQVVFVGDTLTKDVIAPRSHGMQAVLIADPPVRPPSTPSEVPVIGHFADIVSLVAGCSR